MDFSLRDSLSNFSVLFVTVGFLKLRCATLHQPHKIEIFAKIKPSRVTQSAHSVERARSNHDDQDFTCRYCLSLCAALSTSSFGERQKSPARQGQRVWQSQQEDLTKSVMAFPRRTLKELMSFLLRASFFLHRHQESR